MIPSKIAIFSMISFHFFLNRREREGKGGTQHKSAK